MAKHILDDFKDDEELFKRFEHHFLARWMAWLQRNPEHKDADEDTLKVVKAYFKWFYLQGLKDREMK